MIVTAAAAFDDVCTTYQVLDLVGVSVNRKGSSAPIGAAAYCNWLGEWVVALLLYHDARRITRRSRGKERVVE